MSRKTGTLYQDLGADHFQRRSKPAQIRRLVQKLSNFGYEVTVKPLADRGGASKFLSRGLTGAGVPCWMDDCECAQARHQTT
jgi:hypothetical protein